MLSAERHRARIACPTYGLPMNADSRRRRSTARGPTRPGSPSSVSVSTPKRKRETGARQHAGERRPATAAGIVRDHEGRDRPDQHHALDTEIQHAGLSVTSSPSAVIDERRAGDDRREQDAMVIDIACSRRRPARRLRCRVAETGATETCAAVVDEHVGPPAGRRAACPGTRRSATTAAPSDICASSPPM